MNSEVKKRNYGLWLLVCSLWLLTSNPASFSLRVSDGERVHSGSTSPLTAKKPLENLRLSLSLGIPKSQGTRIEGKGVRSFCLEQNIETLTTQLLRDLPSYANRASQRARRLSRTVDVYSYMLVAGKPEFAPLPLNPSGYTEDAPQNASEGVEQVFFTTLERQYTAGKAVELQQFHWLFLTKTKSGWGMVMMFSQIGYYPANKIPTPPRDSSNGVIGQAVNTWLRDCGAK